jgi:predicted phosphodiesterase
MAEYHFDVQSVVVCGDVHGDFEALEALIRERDMHDTLIIVAGDCGFGFEPFEYYQRVWLDSYRTLHRRNCWLVMIRGNHDDPAWFDSHRKKFNRFYTVPDYSVLKVKGHTILVVGGAVSIDRADRQEAMRQYPDQPCWWENETVRFDKEALDGLPAGTSIDAVVTHSAPSFCLPKWKNGLKRNALRDPWLIRDCAHERQQLDILSEYLFAFDHPVKQWFYGHFHTSVAQEINGIRYTGLDELELAPMELP